MTIEVSPVGASTRALARWCNRAGVRFPAMLPNRSIDEAWTALEVPLQHGGDRREVSCHEAATR